MVPTAVAVHSLGAGFAANPLKGLVSPGAGRVSRIFNILERQTYSFPPIELKRVLPALANLIDGKKKPRAAATARGLIFFRLQDRRTPKGAVACQ